MEIKILADCGNSPKNLFLRDFSLAFARGNVDEVLCRVSDDIVVTLVGERELRGRQALADYLGSLPLKRVSEIEISHVLSHGRSGAVDGKIALTDGGQLAFSCVVDFSSAKGDRISRIAVYVI
ncbi:MAG: nuclear transport factor 2 family protein [Chloroflexi bacterium]|nr:nuclear transport factor 2 family protein [Chloroflexota bacterium]